MPHGGGGGSYSGGHISGSHGGGFHGGSHGGSSGNAYRSSDKYFPGARRFVYYYRHRPYVYYSNYVEPAMNGNLVAGIVLLILGFIITFIFFATSPIKNTEYRITTKLNRNYDDEIIIEDHIGIIQEKKELQECLEEFLDETGICICIVTRNKIEGYRLNQFSDINRRSMNEYLNRWEDESHWLIYYEGEELDRSDNWTWYLTCGDDCVPVLDYDQEYAFTRELQNYFMEPESFTFDEAIMEAVGNLNPNLKGGFIFKKNTRIHGQYVDGQHLKLSDIFNYESYGGYIFGGGLLVVGTIFTLVAALSKEENAERRAKAKAYATPDCTTPLMEVACRGCGGMFYFGTVTECPYCQYPVLAGTGNPASNPVDNSGSNPERNHQGSIENCLNQMYQGEIIDYENMHALVDFYERHRVEFDCILFSGTELENALRRMRDYINYKGSLRYYDKMGNTQTITSADFQQFVTEWFDKKIYEIMMENLERNRRQVFYAPAEKQGFILENHAGRLKEVKAWDDIEDFFTDMIKEPNNYMMLKAPYVQFNVLFMQAQRVGEQIDIRIGVKREKGRRAIYGYPCDGSTARRIIMDYFYGRFIPDFQKFRRIE